MKKKLENDNPNVQLLTIKVNILVYVALIFFLLKINKRKK